MKIVLISTLTSLYRRDIWNEIGNISTLFTLVCSSKSINGIKTFDPQKVETIDDFVESKIRYYKGIPYYQHIPNLTRVLSENEILILPGEVSLISTWRILLLSKLFKNKTIIWTHGLYGRESYFRKKLTLLFYSLANDIWVYNSYAKELLEAELKKKSVTIVYNSNTLVNSEKSVSEDKSYNMIVSQINNNDKVILFFGRVSRKRNLSLLIDSFLSLNKNLKNLKLLIIGNIEKKYEVEFHRMISGHQCIIHSIGIYNNHLLEQIFKRSHVMVYPEGVGLAGLHCMNHGLPVLSHNDRSTQKPEFEALQNVSEELLFKKNNPHSMKNAILKILMMKNSDYIKLREKCKTEIVSRWNVTNQIKVIQQNLQKTTYGNH